MAFLNSASGYIPLKYDNMAFVLTAKKNVLVQAGVIVPSPRLDRLMSNGGNVFELPFWNDIQNTTERGGTVAGPSDVLPGSMPNLYTGGSVYPLPDSITSGIERAVRCCRNMSWGASDLSDTLLLDGDPMSFIASRNSWYMSMRLQAMFLSTIKGLYADNDLTPTGSDIHTQFDMTLDISNAAGAGVFQPGTTTFGAAAHILALQKLGDNKRVLKVALMNSVIEAGIALQDLIETIRDSDGQVLYTQFMGMRIVIDDDLTEITTGVYDTFYFGLGCMELGHSTPKTPLAIERYEGAGNGSGMEVLWTRWEWCLHPSGWQNLFVPGNAANAGGPLNTDLELAANWSRRRLERKQVPMVRIRSREA